MRIILFNEIWMILENIDAYDLKRQKYGEQQYRFSLHGLKIQIFRRPQIFEIGQIEYLCEYTKKYRNE